ncbi:actin-histidine N-methyltransferase-like [Haematobia irritans]|uniref:actin-histidine N-methyltransferase-like n=1 Tax=Haematobia irritans TaxID=7368 RepID=UPI003F5076D8
MDLSPRTQYLYSPIGMELRDLIIHLTRIIYIGKTNHLDEWTLYIQIQEILSRIQVLQTPLRCKSSNTDKSSRLVNIDKFYQWVKENGIKYDGIEIAEFPGYDLGLKAKRDFNKNELLFGIPRKLVLCEENEDCAFARKGIFNVSNLNLACSLMLEASKPDSFWKPYIDLLPETYNTVLYFTVDEMAQLKGSNALSAALYQCNLIARCYINIFNWPTAQTIMPDFPEGFTYDLWSPVCATLASELLNYKQKSAVDSMCRRCVLFIDLEVLVCT